MPSIAIYYRYILFKCTVYKNQKGEFMCVMKNNVRLTGRDYMVPHPHRVPPSNKKQPLPLGVSITWDMRGDRVIPCLRVAIVDSVTGKRIKTSRGLMRKGLIPACSYIHRLLVSNKYEISSLKLFLENVRNVLKTESSTHGFNTDDIIDWDNQSYEIK